MPPEQTSQPSPQPWLHGPAPDLILGAGLVYVPLFLLLLAAGQTVESWIPLSLMTLVILAFNTPHVGATLLRVYEREEDRRTYRVLALYVTLLLGALYFAGLYVPLIGSILITAYVTIVPWHFTGQNYGIALIFLRRRGIEITPGTKRLIYLSFVLTYAMTLIALHGEVLSEAYAPIQIAGTRYRFFAAGIPEDWVWYAISALGIGYLYCLTETLSRLRRVASWRELAPTCAVLFTQALWYSVPILIYFVVNPEGIYPFDASNYTYTFVWITQVHAVQYLWISSYYARRQDPSLGQTRYLGKALLAGTAVYGFPALLLAPTVMGHVPYDAGLYVMLAGALNLHHVILDGAIWKLRSGPVARILLRPSESVASAEAPRARRSWLRPLIWASGAVGVALMVVGTLESHFGFSKAIEERDLARLERSAKRLSWLGRASPGAFTEIAVLRAAEGDVAGAMEALEQSIALYPTSSAWFNVGQIRERRGDTEGAVEAYENAARLDPEHADVQARLEAVRARRTGISALPSDASAPASPAASTATRASADPWG